MSGSNLTSIADMLNGVTYDGTNLDDVNVSISNGVYTVLSVNPTHDGEGAEPFTLSSPQDFANELTVDPQAFGGTSPFYYTVVASSSSGVLLEKLDALQQPFVPPRYTALTSDSPTSGEGTVAIGDSFSVNGPAVIPAQTAAPCFVTGARILTARGEVAVEDLAVGDEAITASGGRRSVAWIGQRAVAPRGRAELNPVRVAAGAFAPGVPNADLWLSPGHSVYTDGALIPVSFLINGITITQHDVASVTYWHVELDQHDVLVSQNLPSESYLDTGNRSSFSNAGGAVAMVPDFAPAASALSCAPLVMAGPVLAAVRERLLGRIAAFGYVEAEHEGLRILADGVPVAALQNGRTRRVSGPAGTRALTLVSSSGIPAHHDAQSSDTRRLGVAIDGLRIGGETVSLGNARLVAGFHSVEGRDGAEWRWTDGRASLSIVGSEVVELDIMPTSGWVDYVAGAADERLAG